MKAATRRSQRANAAAAQPAQSMVLPDQKKENDKRGMSKLLRQVKTAVSGLGVSTRSRTRKRTKGLSDITNDAANGAKRPKLNKSGKSKSGRGPSMLTRAQRLAARKKKGKAAKTKAQPVVVVTAADIVKGAPATTTSAKNTAADVMDIAEQEPTGAELLEKDCSVAKDPDIEELATVYTDIDEPHKDNALYSTEYVIDMYEHYTATETQHMPNNDYMREVQTDINSQMRSILVDWLVEVAEEYRLLPETLFLCVNLIDRSLSLFRVSRSKLQLLGCACMLLASKYEEIYAPGVDEFVYISDNTYTNEEVLQMESQVLNALNFTLTVPTAQVFMTRFGRAAGTGNAEKNATKAKEAHTAAAEKLAIATGDTAALVKVVQEKKVAFDAAKKVRQEGLLARYLSEVALLSYEMICYRPSVVAASSIYLARLTLGIEEPWTPTLEHYSGLTVADLKNCTAQLQQKHRLQKSAQLKAVREKYNAETFGAVAQIEATAVLPLI